jgi:cell division inhibitor SepF
MANFLDKIVTSLGWTEAEAVHDDDHEIENPIRSSETKGNTSKVVRMGIGTGSTVNILYPESFEEARDVCNLVKQNISVIINLENMNKDLGQRIVDFISGSVLALDGSINKVSNGVFFIAPSSCEIMSQDMNTDYRAELEDRLNRPWTN